MLVDKLCLKCKKLFINLDKYKNICHICDNCGSKTYDYYGNYQIGTAKINRPSASKRKGVKHDSK